VAAKLDLEPIQVLEVVTFYPGFRQSAPGKYHIRVCRTLSCAMAGSYDLMDSLCKAANIDRSHTDHHHPIAVSPDGKYSIEFAECLASCGFGPVCMVEDDFHEKVEPSKVAELLSKYA
jgi:NADH-quinone oxidoreductase subunit E